MGPWRWSFALLFAFILLTAVWLLLAPARVPLYDGLPTVVPYRYLHTPPGQPNVGPPTSIRTAVPLLNGKSKIAKVHTPDPDGPQAYVILRYGALDVPARVPRVILTINAVDPPAPAPRKRVIDGNVYRFAAVTPNGMPVALRAGTPAVVELLGTGASGTAMVARYTAGRWELLPTETIPNEDYFVARTPSLGDFTLFLKPHRAGALEQALPFIIGGVLVVLLLGLGILLARLNRTRVSVSP